MRHHLFRVLLTVVLTFMATAASATPAHYMVSDINQTGVGAYPGNLVECNGQLFFAAYTRVYGGELWKSVGTEQGTVMVRDIWPGTGDVYPDELTAVDGALFLRLLNGVSTPFSCPFLKSGNKQSFKKSSDRNNGDSSKRSQLQQMPVAAHNDICGSVTGACEELFIRWVLRNRSRHIRKPRYYQCVLVEQFDQRVHIHLSNRKPFSDA